MYYNIWILKIRKHSIDKTWTREAVCRIYLLHEKKISSTQRKAGKKKKINNSRNARKETNPNVILIKVNVSGKVTVLEFTRETERIGQTDRCVC